MTNRSLLMVVAPGLLLVFGMNALAQAPSARVDVSAPILGSSYYESIGTRWGLRGNGWFFSFGGPPPAPGFGGFDPNSGANFGFAGPGGYFQLTAGQGSSRSLGGSASSVTTLNGGTGVFIDAVQRPFVTGFVPVVGAAAPVPTMLDERWARLQAGEQPPPPANLAKRLTEPQAESIRKPAATASSAERGDLSVAQIRAGQAAAKAARQADAGAEIQGLLEKARVAESAGKPSVARLFLQNAAARAGDDAQRARIAAEIERLRRLEHAAK